ncbi:MAG: flagellar biosynthesis protein FlhA, partial [Thermoguttaceae bacterium]
MASVAAPSARLGSMARFQDLILPVGIITSVLVIMIPLPSWLMDLLLSTNITIAVLVLLTTVFVRTPLEFSIFPSLLLATTLFRLVLNVATTRLILSGASTEGLWAAGGVVKTFGEFVARNNIVVGIIIFAIIVVIQFVVITKGATRISEVAARFALDGMPGRQMAIDADLNAGIIDEREAQRRRNDITRQADFFGAMDGASKFVRGDAIAGIVITLINIIGGLFIGIVESGMSLTQAGEIFTKLTIGDGLVTQVPAFLISLAAGLLVTRSSQESDLPSDFLKQLFSRPQALAVAGGFLGVLIFTSLPRIPLIAIGGACVGLALTITRRESQTAAEAKAKKLAETAKQSEERVEDFLTIDPMEIEIGVGLIRLADPKRGGDLLERVQRVRQNMASDIGIILPKVRIRDNMRLEQNQYRIKIADMVVADGTVYPGMSLALDSRMTTGKIQGVETKDPAFGTPAVWIEPGAREQAEMLGYTVVEPGSVIATHLTETVRKNADEILTRDATKHLIDELKRTSPTVVDELIPSGMKLTEVQQILQMLLRESVSIRQLGPILEVLGDYASRIKDHIL